MSNQLHRRLAFRIGGGGTDVSTDSFWDSTDLSTVKLYSHLQFRTRYKSRIGSGTVSNPYRPSDSISLTVHDTVGSFLLLGTGTDPIVVFGMASKMDRQHFYTGDLFRSYKFTGRGDSLARSKINGNLDIFSSEYAYTTSDNTRTTISQLCPGCVTCDQARMHWYFLQYSNETSEVYRVRNAGYTPMYSGAYTTATPTRVVSPVSTNYGMRILHVKASPGDLYPYESKRNSMMTTYMNPGDYTYGSAGTTVNTAEYGMRRPESNRDLWDFTLEALENRDMSPSGYFTNNAPGHMQIVDGGTKMFFLSMLSSNGQELSYRSLTSEYDIRTLSTTATTRSMTDFQTEICSALGIDNGRLQWVWFKFHVDGKKLFLMTADGILAKFHLVNAFDISTMSLVSVTMIPAHEYANTGIRFQRSTYSGPSTFNWEYDYRRPILSADIDPEGQSLIVAVGEYRYVNESVQFPPMANSLIQYRL